MRPRNSLKDLRRVSPGAARRLHGEPRHSRRALAASLSEVGMMTALGLPPDAWQEEVLRSEASGLLLLCSRQAGKSTVTAALALRRALARPESLVLMLAPAWRQSQELFRKCLGFYDRLGRPVPARAETGQHLELANGSRVVSLPGQEETIRGYSGVTLLVVDEAARVPDELYYAVRPMLAVSGGGIIGLSTPYGRRGWFYQEWSHGGAAWERVRVPASDCPRISSAFLERERESLGPRWFAQEYECCFNDREDQVFASEWIEALIDHSIQPIYGGQL